LHREGNLRKEQDPEPGQDPEPEQDPEQDSDSLVRGADPRIRIPNKMPRIWNTGSYNFSSGNTGFKNLKTENMSNLAQLRNILKRNEVLHLIY
jgi:hypothetical protein